MTTLAPQAPSARGPELRHEATILLVEDHEAVRRVAAFGLRQTGYTVLEARDGLEALVQAEQRTGPIDLVVAAVRLPGLDGYSVVRRMRTNRPQLKALLVSGWTDYMIAENAAFLEKPFTPAALVGQVDTLLGGEGKHDAGVKPAVEMTDNSEMHG